VRTDVEVSSDELEPETEDVPTTGVYVSIMPASGMRYTASAYVEGDPDLDQMVELLRAAMAGAAGAHSPELHRRVSGAVQS
jgi:hypothetical protein